MVMELRVADLRVGDRLVRTGESVAWAGAGARTPGGKREIVLSDGRTRIWGRQTLILIERNGG